MFEKYSQACPTRCQYRMTIKECQKISVNFPLIMSTPHKMQAILPKGIITSWIGRTKKSEKLKFKNVLFLLAMRTNLWCEKSLTTAPSSLWYEQRSFQSKYKIWPRFSTVQLLWEKLHFFSRFNRKFQCTTCPADFDYKIYLEMHEYKCHSQKSSVDYVRVITANPYFWLPQKFNKNMEIQSQPL